LPSGTGKSFLGSTATHEPAGQVHELHEPFGLPVFLRSGRCMAWLDLEAPTPDDLTRAASALSLPLDALAPVLPPSMGEPRAEEQDISARSSTAMDVLRGVARYGASASVVAQTPIPLTWDERTSRPTITHLGIAYRLDIPVVDLGTEWAAFEAREEMGADAVLAGPSGPLADKYGLRRLVLIAGPTYVLTAHDGPLTPLTLVKNTWRLNTRAANEGAGTLLYSLLDAIVDGYFPILDGVVRRLEQLEPTLFAARATSSSKDMMQLMFDAKEELLDLRRLVAPQRGIFLELVRRPLPEWNTRLADYFRDVHDHAVRITETIDSYQELVTTILQSYSSQVSIDLARVVRSLTALTVIFGIPTLITTIYGMNFENMPEVNSEYGYPFMILLALAAALGLVVFLRRRRWI
jgi:magnesium transporter